MQYGVEKKTKETICVIWQGHIDYFKKEVDSCCFWFSCLCTRIGEGVSMRWRPTTLSIQKSRCLLHGHRVFGLGGKLCRSSFSCFRVVLMPSVFCALLRLCFWARALPFLLAPLRIKVLRSSLYPLPSRLFGAGLRCCFAGLCSCP